MRARLALFLAMAAACISSCVATPADAQPFDHLTCFKAKDSRRFAATVDLQTGEAAFQPPAACKVTGKAKLFCVPTEKTVQSFTVDGQPATLLNVPGPTPVPVRICYKVKCPTFVPAPQPAFDQFGAGTLSKFKASLLCTPSIVGVPTTTTTTTTTITTTTSTTTTTAPPPACDNGLQDGTETDIDCGGATCPGCANGQDCLINADCLSGSCAGSVCVPTSLNETDTSAEADFCNIQFPSSFAEVTGQPSPIIYGRIFEAGVTDPAGAPVGISGEVGFGPNGSDPTTNFTWTWVAAAFNVQVGNDDEFQGSFTVPNVVGTYSYAYRFTNDGGLSYTYCDLDGAGSNAGLTFSAANLGAMSVNP
jgi:hypothetical protein